MRFFAALLLAWVLAPLVTAEDEGACSSTDCTYDACFEELLNLQWEEQVLDDCSSLLVSTVTPDPRTVTKTRYVDAITTEDVLRTFLTVKNTTETINVSVQKTDVIGTTSTQTIDVTATISVSETDTVYVDATATSISSIVSTSYKDEPATSTVDIMTTTTDYGIALTAVSVTSMITLTDVSGVTTVLATTVIDDVTSTITSSYTTTITEVLATATESLTAIKRRNKLDSFETLVPGYCNSCTELYKFSSACSCLGVSPTTITLPRPTQSVTVRETRMATVTEEKFTTSTALATHLVTETIRVKHTSYSTDAAVLSTTDTTFNVPYTSVTITDLTTAATVEQDVTYETTLVPTTVSTSDTTSITSTETITSDTSTSTTVFSFTNEATVYTTNTATSFNPTITDISAVATSTVPEATATAIPNFVLQYSTGSGESAIFNYLLYEAEDSTQAEFEFTTDLAAASLFNFQDGQLVSPPHNTLLSFVSTFNQVSVVNMFVPPRPDNSALYCTLNDSNELTCEGGGYNALANCGGNLYAYTTDDPITGYCPGVVEITLTALDI